MTRPWLVLDCYYLCHRAFYTMGSLSYNDVKTGVIFGFFKDVIALISQFQASVVVFCFDANGSKRKELFPEYKLKRHTKELDENEKLARFELKRQIKKLRTRYLQMAGYRNVFWEDGYEADDIIATTVAQAPLDQDVVIVTADKDLWQLIAPHVSVYNPDRMKMQTFQTFHATYGMMPRKWAFKLALAGCKTDEVPGVEGVGEKTALKYIRGELNSKSKAAKRIENGWREIKRNRALVKLPFAGAPTFEIRSDKLTEAGWQRVCKELGMESLAGRMGEVGRRPKATRESLNLF